MHSQRHNEPSPHFHQHPDLPGPMERNDSVASTERWTPHHINQTIQKVRFVVAMTVFVWLMRYVLDHIYKTKADL